MEHRTVSLAEQVFERLENEILSGKFPRGTVLTEMNLVTELGVSRTPIREAIHRLEQEHVIETTTKGILILGVTKKDLRDISRSGCGSRGSRRRRRRNASPTRNSPNCASLLNCRSSTSRKTTPNTSAGWTVCSIG